MESLKLLAEKLRGHEANIEHSRRLWNSDIRPKLEADLRALVVELNLSLEVRLNDAIVGMETITLAFSDKASGLVFNPNNVGNTLEKRSGIIMKSGATLNFSYVYRGNVAVWMTYPFMEAIMPQPPQPVELKLYDLEEINTETIHLMAEKFLSALLIWHSDEIVSSLGNGSRIGFGNKKS